MLPVSKRQLILVKASLESLVFMKKTFSIYEKTFSNYEITKIMTRVT